mgnify:CR=1 FL=1
MHTKIEHTINTRLFSLLDMLKIIDICRYLQFLLLLQQGVRIPWQSDKFWGVLLGQGRTFGFFNIFTDILTSINKTGFCWRK